LEKKLQAISYFLAAILVACGEFLLIHLQVEKFSNSLILDKKN